MGLKFLHVKVIFLFFYFTCLFCQGNLYCYLKLKSTFLGNAYFHSFNVSIFGEPIKCADSLKNEIPSLNSFISPLTKVFYLH